jgi:predicted N-acetyltransferase YhbS
VASKGVIQDTRTQPGFVAVEAGEAIGYILYNIADNACEISVFESLLENRGVGRALIDAAVQAAENAGLGRVWLMTTKQSKVKNVYGW